MIPAAFLNLCHACAGTGHGERTGALCPRCHGTRLEPTQDPMADPEEVRLAQLEARCAELERENRTASAEGFLHGRTEAAAMVREVRLRFELVDGVVTVTRVANALVELEAKLRGDGQP